MKARGGVDWMVVVSRLVFSGVFVWAGWGKLRDPLAFADSVAAFRMLPHPVFVSLVALGVPVLEWMTAVLLWVPRWHRAARWVMTGLFALFAVALSVAQVRGLEIDCGCFGSGEPTKWSVPLAWGRAVGLLGWAIWYGWRVRGRSADQ